MQIIARSGFSELIVRVLERCIAFEIYMIILIVLILGNCINLQNDHTERYRIS